MDIGLQATDLKRKRLKGKGLHHLLQALLPTGQFNIELLFYFVII